MFKILCMHCSKYVLEQYQCLGSLGMRIDGSAAKRFTAIMCWRPLRFSATARAVARAAPWQKILRRKKSVGLRPVLQKLDGLKITVRA